MAKKKAAKCEVDFMKQYVKYDEASARNCYLQMLCELQTSVASGNINNFMRLINNIEKISTVEKEATIKKFCNDSNNPLKGTNLFILACKHDQPGVLKYILNNDNVLKNDFIISGRNVHPGDVDEESHNAFYYAIRSGNVENFEILIDWALKFFDTYLDELDEIISQPYEELKLRQVPLTEEMEVCVENRLINIRFFTDNFKQKECITNDVDNIIKRIELVIEKIELLTTDYSNAEVDEIFLYITTFITQNIHVLKRQLKSTYDRLPWEEMEFCLVCFVSSHTKRQEINLFYLAILHKRTVLKHLDNFSKKLNEVKESIGVSNENLFKIPSIDRNTVVANIIRKNPEFEELYKNYRQIRDVHSLEKIGNYITLASSVDPNNREGQMIIKRVLQLIGEYLKNTLESPKLSDLTSDLLFLTLSKNTRKIITGLRDSLSHITLFKETNSKIFTGVQSDLRKVGDKLIDILYANKIKFFFFIHMKIVGSENSDELKEFLKSLKNIPVDEMVFPNLITIEHEKLEKLIRELSSNIPDKTNFEQKLFTQITYKMRFENRKIKIIKENYFMNLHLLKDLFDKLENDNADPHNLIAIKFLSKEALKKISHSSESHNLREIAELSRKIYLSVRSRNCNENLDEINKIVYEIFFIAEFQTGGIKGIEDFQSKLKEENTSKKKKKQMYEAQVLNTHLELKLSELKTVLRNNLSNVETTPKFYRYEKDKKLQAAAEMLVLEIMSILEISNSNDNYLVNNSFFLDDSYPLLIGRSLRNYLAHDNILFDVLLYNPSTIVILNAEKITKADIIKNKKKIGKMITDNPISVGRNYYRCLEIITCQRKMFTALEEGNIKNLKDCLKNGADITSRDINLETALHYAAKGPSLDVIKFVLEQNVLLSVKDKNGSNPLHIAAACGNKNTAEYFIEEADLPVDDVDYYVKTPLHIAAQKGHANIVQLLLKHNADSSKRDSKGILAFNHAIRNNHLNIVKLLFEKDRNADIIEVMGGFTPLHEAAECGHLEIVIFLLQNGANVNVKNDRSWTPLHAAALNGNLDIVNVCIAYGADINARVIEGCTPLHYALEHGFEEIANMLLNHGAEVNASDKVYNNTPLHYAARFAHEIIANTLIKYGADAAVSTIEGITPLHFAAQSGSLRIVTILLKQGVDINAKDICNRTPLHYAANSKHIAVVEVLVKYEAKIDAEDDNGFTPLYVAALEGCMDIVKFLLKHKANVNYKDIRGNTILHAAVSTDCKKLVDILIKNNAEIHAKNRVGLTPLHVASIEGREDALISLLEHKSEVNIGDIDGFTPLHFAIVEGHEEIVKILIKNKANINARSTEGDITSLHMSIVSGHKIITEILISNGADVDANNSYIRTPLHTAVKYNNKEIVEILVKYGATVDDKDGGPLWLAVHAGYTDIVKFLIKNKTQLHVVNSNNVTLLHVAAERGHKEIVKILLLKRGVDVNAKTRDSVTPLFIAAQIGHEEVVEMLIENGASTHIPSIDDLDPLYVAAGNGHSHIVKILLDNKASINVNKYRTLLELAVEKGHLDVLKVLLQYRKTDMNAKGDDTFTLLHIAAQGNNLEIVKYLVHEGADINSKNDKGSKPIHIAAREGFKDAVEYLLSEGCSIDVLGAFNQTLLHYAALEGRLEVVKYLIDRGADVNAKDSCGLNPIHIAAGYGFLDTIVVLLKNGATYNPTDHQGRKPLDMVTKKAVFDYLLSIKQFFYAVKSNNLTQIKEYIKGRIVIDVKNANGAAPLHFAAWKGHEEILNILLQNNANGNIVHNKGNTPLHYAVKFSHLKVVKTLLRYGAIFNAVADNGKTPADFSTDKNIVSLLKLVSDSFQSISNNNTKIIGYLNKIKDIDTVRAVMGACNEEKETLVVVGIRCNHTKVDQLKDILQNGSSHPLKRALELEVHGDYELALLILNQVYEKRRHILGSNNPGTLEIEQRIARILYNKCNYNEALGKLENIYQKQKQMLGINNKETLYTESRLALVLHRQGKNEEALPIFQKVYQTQKEIIGPNHEDTLITMFDMALVLNEQGHHEEALNINIKVYEKYKQKFGANHLRTIRAQNNIAMILDTQGKYDLSLKNYTEVFEKKMLLLGSYHANTLKTLRSIAAVIGHQKKYYEAVEANKEILKVQNIVLGPNNPESLKTQYILGNLYFEQKKFASAFKIYTECFEKLKCVLGSNNTTVLDISQKLAEIKLIYKFQGGEASEFILHMNDDIKTAVMNGHRLTVLRLLKEGTDVDEKDNDGVSLLHFAVNYEHVEIVRILIKNGANVFQVTNRGNTPLHTAVLKDNIDIAEVLLQHVEQDKLSGFINAKTTSGNTAVLHVVAENGSLEICKMLLRYGAIYDIKNNRGKKPQDISSDQMVTHLLKLVEDLFDDAENGNGDIILKLKSIRPDEFLAATNARNNQGYTLLQVVISKQYTCIAYKLSEMIKRKS